MRAAMRAKAPGAEAPVVPRSPALGALRLTLVRSGGEGRRRGSALSLCRTPHTARGRPFRQTAWRNPSRTCASLGHQKGGRGHHTASRAHTENKRQNWGCFCFFCLWPCSAASPRPSGGPAAPQPRGQGGKHDWSVANTRNGRTEPLGFPPGSPRVVRGSPLEGQRWPVVSFKKSGGTRPAHRRNSAREATPPLASQLEASW